MRMLWIVGIVAALLVSGVILASAGTSTERAQATAKAAPACGNPDCTCGCNEGKPCTCGAKEAGSCGADTCGLGCGGSCGISGCGCGK